MPIQIKNKVDCTGCEACSNICPKRCITMGKDDGWFRYPEIDGDKCINCDLCVKVCPVINSCTTSDGAPDVFAAWSKDSEVRYNSTSGGAFSELAKIVLNQGGYVVGAVYTPDNMVAHAIINTQDDLVKVRQSKYIQSTIGDVYSRVKKLLDSDQSVLFCGAPCQVAGLKNYLRKPYKNLITVDFICRGMNSPKAYRYWLNELEQTSGGKATRVWFKYKQDGWKKSPYCTRVDFSNGKSVVSSGENNAFMVGYLQGNLYMRPSCSNCHFKGAERCSDITLADFWKISDELDDNKGTSMILINSESGHALFEKVQSQLLFYKRDLEEITAGNVCFIGSVTINPKSDEFLSKLEDKPFSKLVAQYIGKHSIKKNIRKAVNMVKQLFRH